MIEIVRSAIARAMDICQYATCSDIRGEHCECGLAAAAAIAAMSEPTPAMWAAVNLTTRGKVRNLCTVEGWHAMIEAATR